MKKFLLSVILQLLSVQAHALEFNVINEKLIITGEIVDGDFDSYQKAIAGMQIKIVSVNSIGGVVDEAIKIGDDIFSKKYNVEVFEKCISSCANYIFTAGINKIIDRKSIVVWHGSPSKLCAHTLPKIQISSMSEIQALEYQEYLKKIEIASDEFFSRIKVDPRITCLNSMYINLYAHYDGYTMWPEAMAQFGVFGVTNYRPTKNSLTIKNKSVINFKNKIFIFE